MTIDRFAPDHLGLRAQMMIAAAGLRFSAVEFLRDWGCRRAGWRGRAGEREMAA